MSGAGGDDAAAGTGAVPAKRGAGRRSPVLPVALLAVAAAGLWASSRMTWVTVQSSDGLTEPRTDELNGSTWFGALTPLALVLLASIAAVLAVKGALRQVLGVLIAVVAAVAAVPGFAVVVGAGRPAERAGTLAELPARAVVTSVQTHVAPALLSLVAAALALVAGALLTMRREQPTSLSGRYDAPAARKAAATEQVTAQRGDKGSAPLSERVLWDAIDAGTDPTADDDGEPPAPEQPGDRPAPR
ncbi:TIGR02234 family membrane protein [Nocardia thailandica]|uniref:TIGR02234 family membrane protein n=1 Tax=Nocardia thailandica TaxID=257275 RepID=UPI00031CCECE|nr:TIGR02234 family membrane protein [Nocardia thailandica]